MGVLLYQPRGKVKGFYEEKMKIGFNGRRPIADIFTHPTSLRWSTSLRLRRKEVVSIKETGTPLSAAGEEREGRAKQDRVSPLLPKISKYLFLI
jgi:hypothetical protein